MFHNSSTTIGGGSHSAVKDPRSNWGVQNKTNYELGIDKIPKATDYANRFAATQQAFSTNAIKAPYDESKKNKAKMTSDSIKIANNEFQETAVSSKIQFRDTLAASRSINTGLDKMTTSYITGSHFKPGYGGFGGQAENQRAF